MRAGKSTINYGWYVMAAAFAILFVNAGIRLMAGVFEKPMVAEFGWTRGEFSAVIFLSTAVFAVAIAVAGRLYDRFGASRVVFFSSLLFSGGLVLTSTMTGLWQFVLFYGLICGAGLGGLSSPIFGAIVSHWFVRARGTAVSVTMSGTSLGQFALVPLFTRFYLHEGWRSTLLWMGVLGFAVNTVLVVLVLRGDPEDLGGEPFGAAEPDASSDAPSAALPGARAEPRSLTLREAMRTWSFWLFTVAMFVCGAGDFLLTTHLVAMATDHGVPTSTAVAMLAWFGLLSLGGILLAGPASDLVGNKIPIAASFAVRVVVFSLVVRSQAPWALWTLALGFGFTFLITAPLSTTLTGRMYGFGNIGLISGFITTIHHLGGGLWAYLGGVVFDATGAYTAIMAVSAVASAVALVCTLFIKEVRHLPPEEVEEPGSDGVRVACVEAGIQ